MPIYEGADCLARALDFVAADVNAGRETAHWHHHGGFG
jgi:hypothetical protein